MTEHEEVHIPVMKWAKIFVEILDLLGFQIAAKN